MRKRLRWRSIALGTRRGLGACINRRCCIWVRSKISKYLETSKAAMGRMASDGALTRETYVWTAGQDGWKLAEDVMELAQLFTVLPPPPPESRRHAVRQVIFPPALAEAVAASGFSPAVRAGDLLFLTRATGAGSDGEMPEDIALQTRNALEKVAMILHAADVTMEAVVEVTSYHIGLRDPFDEVSSIFHELFGTPLPA